MGIRKYFKKGIKKSLRNESKGFEKWSNKDSNLGPPACKAGALNQLSY
jgi:hypothetical protein